MGRTDRARRGRRLRAAAGERHGGAARYEIGVDGVLDPRWTAWFGGLAVQRDGGQTIISGEVIDQGALYGLLNRIGDLGLVLILVRRLDRGQWGDHVSRDAAPAG